MARAKKKTPAKASEKRKREIMHVSVPPGDTERVKKAAARSPGSQTLSAFVRLAYDEKIARDKLG